MGRAIDMENDISALRVRIEKLDNTIRGMVSKLDSLDEKSSKTIKVNLTEDINEKEKADNKGNSKDGKQSKHKSRKSSKKNV